MSKSHFCGGGFRTAPVCLFLLWTFVGGVCAEPQKGPENSDIRVTRYALYTTVQVRIVAEGSADELRAVGEETIRHMEREADLLNVYDSSSALSLLNQQRSTTNTQLIKTLRWVKQLMEETEGGFNPMAGPLIRYWEEIRDGDREIDRSRIESLMSLCNPDFLHLSPIRASITEASAEIHLGGVIKGYAIDRGKAFLRSRGYKNALINTGGDLYASGRKGAGKFWIFGIRHPRKEDYFARMPVSDQAVASSGDYERFFVVDGKTYHHIIDPRTGFPAEGTICSTVVAGDAFTADAWATAAVVLGPRAVELAENHNGAVPKDERIEVLVVLRDGTVVTTSRFPFADEPVSIIQLDR